MNIILIILLVIVAVIAIAVVLYFIAKSKGKIIINLDKLEFSPGNKITGKILLKLKKETEAKSLYVGLKGIQTIRSYKSKGVNRSRSVIFKFQKPIDGEKMYPAGEKEYKFELSIPNDINKRATGNAIADTLVKSAEILSGRNSNVKWYVFSSLEVKGFNISKKVRINII